MKGAACKDKLTEAVVSMFGLTVSIFTVLHHSNQTGGLTVQKPVKDRHHLPNHQAPPIWKTHIQWRLCILVGEVSTTDFNSVQYSIGLLSVNE